MKKLKKLSLHHLSQAEISKKEMSTLTGGGGWCTCRYLCNCSCPCRYAGAQEGPYDSYYGGSSTEANHDANGENSDERYGTNVSQFLADTGYY